MNWSMLISWPSPVRDDSKQSPQQLSDTSGEPHQSRIIHFAPGADAGKAEPSREGVHHLLVAGAWNQ